LAGHEGSSGGRANGCGGVSLGEALALRREAIEVGRFIETVAVTAKLGPAEVVGENKDDVRRRIRRGRQKEAAKRKDAGKGQELPVESVHNFCFGLRFTQYCGIKVHWPQLSAKSQGPATAEIDFGWALA
jgi:hypothetical protein